MPAPLPDHRPRQLSWVAAELGFDLTELYRVLRLPGAPVPATKLAGVELWDIAEVREFLSRDSGTHGCKPRGRRGI